MSTVAWHEIAISIAILVGSTIGIGILSAKIYRVGVLLYGMRPKFSTIMKTVLKTVRQIEFSLTSLNTVKQLKYS